MMNKIKEFFSENSTLLVMLVLAAGFEIVLRTAFGIAAHAIEIVAIMFGIIALDLGRRQKVSNFFFNIIFSLLLIAWFSSIGLYGQVAMRSFVALTSVVGIYFWLHPGRNIKFMRPMNLPNTERFALYSSIAIISVAMLAVFGPLRAMDYSVAGLIIIGTMLLTRKKIDAWICFLLADITSLFLFPFVGTYVYLAFVGCAIYTEINSIRRWGKLVKRRGG